MATAASQSVKLRSQTTSGARRGRPAADAPAAPVMLVVLLVVGFGRRCVGPRLVAIAGCPYGLCACRPRASYRSRLEQENRELKVELATLTSPDRLDAMARRRLGLAAAGERSGHRLAMRRSLSSEIACAWAVRQGVFLWLFLVVGGRAFQLQVLQGDKLDAPRPAPAFEGMDRAAQSAARYRPRRRAVGVELGSRSRFTPAPSDSGRGEA